MAASVDPAPSSAHGELRLPGQPGPADAEQPVGASEPSQTGQLAELLEPAEARDPADAEGAAQRRRRQLRRRWWAGAVVTWTLGAACAGGAVGFELFDRWAPHSITIAAPAASTSGAAGTNPSTKGGSAPQVTVPDVTGMNRADAVQALADAGVDPKTVTVDQAPYVADAGTVVAQDPLHGAHDPAAVTLTVAEAATVPSVVGQTADAATNAVEDLGGTVTVTQIYRHGTTPGTVVAVTPKPGQPLTGRVTLDVATAASAVFLSDLRTTDSDCGTDDQRASGGKAFPQSVVCSLDPAQPSQATWVLGRHADELHLTFGVTDDSPPGSTARLEVRTDGKVAKAVTAQFGAPVDVTVPLTGVIQLQLTMTGGAGATGIAGSAEVRGGPAGIDALGTSGS